ncbi:MAG TPA: DegT/DnrJ/EryC1/StrS family aminotransferase [Candidatus Hydrogenedentes bacterium]|nr:DegT/DnrJ/EryC1/StrS family aminotransferase [Candidatus Hydrogenedentota bacterium]
MIPHSKPCLGHEETEAVARVLQSGYLSQGNEVAAFEEECAAFVGRRYGVAVNSGTAALHLALVVLGVGKDDPVAFPSYVCAALLQAVSWQQARPVLCDIGPDFNLLAETIPAECPTVIVPHLFGARAPLPEGKVVIEDIAQSIGGSTGRASQMAIVSFYATKLLSTGEGGMLLTDDAALAEEARDRREYDNRDDFTIRYAYKMTDFQAALGRVQLIRLPGFVQRRREIAQAYSEAWKDLPVRLPQGKDHVFFRYVIAAKDRDRLETYLRNEGIEAKRPVYRPVHQYLGGFFPNSEHAHLESLSIPIYPALISNEIQNMIKSVIKFFG